MGTSEDTDAGRDGQRVGRNPEKIQRKAARNLLEKLLAGSTREVGTGPDGYPIIERVPPLLQSPDLTFREWRESVLRPVVRAIAGPNEGDEWVRQLARLPRFREELTRGDRRAELAKTGEPLDLLHGSDDPETEALLRRVRAALVRQGLPAVGAAMIQRATPDRETLDLERAAWPLRDAITDAATDVVVAKRDRSKRTRLSRDDELAAARDEDDSPRVTAEELVRLSRGANGERIKARGLLALVHRRLPRELRRVLRVTLEVVAEEGRRNQSEAARRLGMGRTAYRNRWERIVEIAKGT